MTALLDAVVRVSAVLGLALAALPLLRSSPASARRLVLWVAFVAALALPLVPTWHVDAPVLHGLVGRVVAEPAAPGLPAPAIPAALPKVARPRDWLAIAWALGAMLVAARLALGLVAVRRMVRRASACPEAWQAAIARAESITGLRAEVCLSSEVRAPAVTGLLSPIVLVPTASVSWTEERKLSVLLHELAHVAAHDLAMQVLVTLTCSLHWFNPLVWLAARKVRIERELAADEAVLQRGMRASDYAADLLAIAGAAPSGAIAIGEKLVPKRIAAIVAARRPRGLSRKGAWALMVASAAVALAVACAPTVDSTPPKGSLTAAPPVASGGTLDADLQALAERELDRTVREWSAAGGTILVLSPSGEVLADAGGRSDQAYVTGSTMKTISLAAAIDEGVVTESDVFDCSHGERGGKVLSDAKPLGQAKLPELVSTSSNVGFAQIFDRLGGRRLDSTLRRFHFSTPPALAAAPSGDWDGALIAIGATMTATPRQVALAYSVLADGGHGIVKPGTASRVTALLEGVVASEQGTGRKAAVAGVRVAGKTGSSEWTSPEGKKSTYASFVGYAPADHPRYVIFVGVESPTGKEPWGGSVAGPVFARIAAHALRR
ncbi:MAG: hypothetical protein HY898_15615 [Deltaproteobacteria bacterium]|nr:hypothetical protein [Deltaproteobacteria bacterium]